MRKSPPLIILLFFCFSAFAQKNDDKVKEFIRLSTEYIETNLDSAEYFANLAIQKSTPSHNNWGIGSGYNNLGLVSEYRGEYANSIMLYKKALTYFEKGNIQDGLAICNKNVGVGYYYLADYEKSLDYLFNSLKSFEKIDHKKGVASVTNNIGAVYAARRDFDNALSYYKKAAALKEESEIDPSSTYLNIGNIYADKEDYDSAIQYYQKAKDIKLKSGDQRSLPNAYANIGWTQVSMKDYESAIVNIDSAFLLDTKLNDIYGLANDHSIYGRYYMAISDYPQAKEHLLKALEITKNENLLSLKGDVLLLLSEVFASTEDFKQALHYHEDYLRVNDSIYYQENKEAIANMEVLYETEKKDQEIVLLNNENELQQSIIDKNRIFRWGLILVSFLLLIILVIGYSRYKLKTKTNEILQEKNTELEELNATKDKMFSIISHDLINPLSAFRNVARGLSAGVEKLPREKVKTLAEQMSQSSSRLFDTLVNLLKWSASQSNKVTICYSSVNVYQQMDAIFNLYEAYASEKGLVLQNNVEQGLLLQTDENILETVLRNVIMNAIKFSHPGGKVSVKNNGTNLAIEDHGIGMDQTDISKLFDIREDTRSIGNSSEKGTGLGLILCAELLEKVGATIRIESESGKGTCVFIIFE